MGEFLFTFCMRIIAGGALGGIAGALVARRAVLEHLAEGRLFGGRLLAAIIAGAVICAATTPRALGPGNRRRRHAPNRRAGARQARADTTQTVREGRQRNRGSRAEVRNRGSGSMRIEVSLPEGWKRISTTQGHAYRPTRTGGGTLRLQLVPGAPHLVHDGEATLARLHKLQETTELGQGKVLRSSHGRASNGVVAATVRQHARHGVIAQWLLPLGDVMALGTYQMGSRETVERELQEAHRVIVTTRYVAVKKPLSRVI